MRILNIGCGNDTYGTDFLDMHPQRKGVKKYDVDNEVLPYNDNIFDEVRFFFVFEHLKDRTNILKEINRVLKVGGKLDLKTDNASYWYYALENTTHSGRYEKVKMYGGNDRHFSLFTPHHLINFFEDANFNITELNEDYENAKGENLGIKGKIVLVINYIVSHIKPIKRIGYSQIQIIGEKRKSAESINKANNLEAKE